MWNRTRFQVAHKMLSILNKFGPRSLGFTQTCYSTTTTTTHKPGISRANISDITVYRHFITRKRKYWLVLLTCPVQKLPWKTHYFHSCLYYIPHSNFLNHCYHIVILSLSTRYTNIKSINATAPFSPL